MKSDGSSDVQLPVVPIGLGLGLGLDVRVIMRRLEAVMNAAGLQPQ